MSTVGERSLQSHPNIVSRLRDYNPNTLTQYLIDRAGTRSWSLQFRQVLI